MRDIGTHTPGQLSKSTSYEADGEGLPNVIPAKAGIQVPSPKSSRPLREGVRGRGNNPFVLSLSNEGGREAVGQLGWTSTSIPNPTDRGSEKPIMISVISSN